MHPQPRVQMKKAHEHSHHRYNAIIRHSLRDGFTGSFVLAPETGYSIHTFFSVRVVPYLMRRKSSRPIRITFGPGFP